MSAKSAASSRETRTASHYFALAQSAETTRASSGKTAVFRLENALIAPIGRTQKAGTH
jgi:hypothetical protein